MLGIQKILVSEHQVNSLYQDGEVKLQETGDINSYAVIHNETNEKHSAIVRYVGGSMWVRIKNDLQFLDVKPRDSKQTAFADSLANQDTPICVCTGEAGTGKTTMALAYAVGRWKADRSAIFLSKSTTTVGEGKAFGPVPGDISEKYAPYLASYEIALKRILGKAAKMQLELMKRQGELQYIPIEMIRGSEFSNCTFVLDEVQNMTWHELKTVASRMGENTKLILLGDLEQIDIDCLKEDTGVFKLVNSAPFKNSTLSSFIELEAQYRSPMTALISEADKWIKNEQK